MEKYNGKLNHTVNNSNISTKAKALWDARGSSLRSRDLACPHVLLGRDGGAMPTFQKWADVAELTSTHGPHDGRGSFEHTKWQAKMTRWEAPDQRRTSPCS